MPGSERRRTRSQEQMDEYVARVRQHLASAAEFISERVKRLRQKEEELRQHPDYLKAIAFRETFETKEGVEYKWVVEYAKITYDQLHDAYVNLDEKADSIIRHLTGGTGLFALGAIALISRENAPIAFAALPSILCALRSINLAISARRPGETDMPPTVEGALQYANAYNDSEAMFLGQWHQSCEGMALSVARKARKVNRAYRWYFAALALLTVPFLGGIVWKSLQPESPSQPVPVKIIR